MRQSKSVSRLLMGSILSAMLAGLVPVVYAQEGSGGAGAGGGGAAGGAAASGGATGPGAMGAPGAPPSTGAGSPSDGSMGRSGD
jgi:hypothetical protein